MDITNSYSTERLIRLAFDYGLISDYRMTPSKIELILAGTVFTFDPEETRFFLRGLIRGFEERGRQVRRSFESAPRTAAAAA